MDPFSFWTVTAQCKMLSGVIYCYIPFLIDINECSSSTACSDVNSFCLNTIGSFMCICNEGYELATDGGCQGKAIY